MNEYGLRMTRSPRGGRLRWEENTSQLYDLDYRNYDQVLGRMNQVDPMASKYVLDKTVSFTDSQQQTIQANEAKTN
jgi:hypothetical protein